VRKQAATTTLRPLVVVRLNLNVWAPRRACWTVRAVDLAANGRGVVDVDEVVRTSP
jgi:hypothetical protein